MDEILRHKDVNANRIELMAEPCPVYIFDHWEIENGEGQYQNTGDTNPLEMYMNKWESQAGEIHVSPNTNELNVFAFFKKLSALVVDGSETFFNTEGDTTLANLGYDLTYFDSPSKIEVGSRLHENEIFVFNGHGNGPVIQLCGDGKCKDGNCDGYSLNILMFEIFEKVISIFLFTYLHVR